MRPVRLPPCAAGASPTTTRRASGSPKPGSGRAQYSSEAKARGAESEASLRQATSRGQATHAEIRSPQRRQRERALSVGIGGHQCHGTVSGMQRTRRQAAPPTDVCFVRHGSTPTTGKVLPGRARGLHLSDAGRAEAARAAEHFRALEVEAVYASPLERARETAAPIGSASGRRVAIERGLVECDFGEWTGADLSKLRRLPQWKAVQRYPSGFRFPSGESFQELQARLQSISRSCASATPARQSWRCSMPIASKLSPPSRSGFPSICSSEFHRALLDERSSPMVQRDPPCSR